MADFAQLQRLIRIDADSYLDEFLEQLRHFEAAFQIFKARPDESSKEFTRLVRFVASVADAYPKETSRFVLDLMELLEKNYEALDKDLRKALVQSLMQLRKRRRVELIQLLPLFFRLFGCKDKPLRHMIFGFLVSDIRTAEKVQRQHQHNRQIKGFLFNILRDNNVAIAKKALAILTDLWRRQVCLKCILWNPERFSNIPDMAGRSYGECDCIRIVASRSHCCLCRCEVLFGI